MPTDAPRKFLFFHLIPQGGPWNRGPYFSAVLNAPTTALLPIGSTDGRAGVILERTVQVGKLHIMRGGASIGPKFHSGILAWCAIGGAFVREELQTMARLDPSQLKIVSTVP